MNEENDTLKLLLELKANIDRIFRDFMSKVPSGESLDLDIQYDPPIDILDTGDELVLIMDVPGFSKDDIRIKATEDIIEIRATSSDTKRPRGRYILKQRLCDRNLVKRVELPIKIRPHEVRAILKSGLLEIHMPKAEVVKEIEVMVE